MIVKDVLVEALARANHCQRGFGADASEVVMAEKHFNSQMRKYSDSNLITAYQKIYTIPGTSITEDVEEKGIVIGKPTYKKGIRITEGTNDAKPTITTWLNSGHIIGRDYYYATDSGKYYTPVLSKYDGKAKVTFNIQGVPSATISANANLSQISESGTSLTDWRSSSDQTIERYVETEIVMTASAGAELVPGPSSTTVYGFPLTYEGSTGDAFAIGYITEKTASYTWHEMTTSETANIIETDVDVKVNDMVKIMSAIFKDNYGKWRTLQFIPLTDFYINDMNDIYNSANDGENKIRLRLKKDKVGKEIRLVYNCSMKFDKSQTIELPEAHIELLTLATTVAIITEDGDADQSMLQNYQAQLSDLEAQIKASTLVTRRITREPNGFYGMNRIDYLKSGLWI